MLKSGINEYTYLFENHFYDNICCFNTTYYLVILKNGVEANMFKFVSSLPIYRTQLFVIL